MSDSRIDLRSHRGDMTLSFTHDQPLNGRRERWSVSLEPDDPLTYGFDEASTVLDEDSIRRLFHWLMTGEALPIDADLPRVRNYRHNVRRAIVRLLEAAEQCQNQRRTLMERLMGPSLAATFSHAARVVSEEVDQ